MANPQLFASAQPVAASTPATDTVNSAGGIAYSHPDKHALINLAFTGTFPDATYYDGKAGSTQLSRVLALTEKINDPVFVAKVAIASRHGGKLKDMPMALLLCVAKQTPQELIYRKKLVSRQDSNYTAFARREDGLALRALEDSRARLVGTVFTRVVDDGKVLKTLFQMIRSGVFGVKCLASMFERLFGARLNEFNDGALLSAAVGDKPSIGDVLRCARPRPRDNGRRAFFGWLLNSPVEDWAPASYTDLPEPVKILDAYRKAETEVLQVELLKQLDGYIRWDLLSDAAKGPLVWRQIAATMGPKALRMNLNTLQRHDVFADAAAVADVANRLCDPDAVRRSKQLPYEFYAAYKFAGVDMPHAIRQALSRATDVACENIPALPGPVVIGVDVSGSMNSPATGERAGHTSKLTCKDAAALFAAAILKKNPDSLLIPFSDRLYPDFRVDPDDSILSIADRLAKRSAGGTAIQLPIEAALKTARPLAGAIILSDNESWIDPRYLRNGLSGGRTMLFQCWAQFVANQRSLGKYPEPKLVCYDLQMSGTTQAPERNDILNLSGFSDVSFSIVADFFAGNLPFDPKTRELDTVSRFVSLVEGIQL